MRSEPAPTHCATCERAYDATPDEPHRCVCGGPLELGAQPPPPALPDGPIAGVWDLPDALPAGPPVDIGAGGTPLVDAPSFDAGFKLETCNPTGSFKDRGAALVCSRALALGVERLKEDSSGNAGLAIAAHAARAGIGASIFVPAAAAGSVLAAIHATGADVHPVEGDRTAVAAACEAADRGWYASHAWRPEFYAGTATLAWELVADRGGRPPDAVVLPVGHGTLLLGIARGFDALLGAGTIEAVPRLYAAQLRGAGSLLPGGGAVDPALAPGIRIGTPARGDQLERAIADSGGRVVPVAADAVGPTRDRLARRGFDAGPTAAVGVAARGSLRDRGDEPADADVTVVLTGRARDR